MTLRSGRSRHGGRPFVEVLPVDELPAGVPAGADELSRAAAAERGAFTEGNRRSALGGRARAGSTRLAARLSLDALPDGSAFAPYRRAAAGFRRAQCASLSASVGGGHCGPGPSSIVASAALALAWSRYLGDVAARTGDGEMATRAARLAVESRQHLLAAHELCAREAAARPRPEPAWMRVLQAGDPPAVLPPPRAGHTGGGRGIQAGTPAEGEHAPFFDDSHVSGERFPETAKTIETIPESTSFTETLETVETDPAPSAATIPAPEYERPELPEHLRPRANPLWDAEVQRQNALAQQRRDALDADREGRFGRFVPTPLSVPAWMQPIHTTAPPADLDAKLAQIREQARLDAMKRR
jgi:hypothetical protein